MSTFQGGSETQEKTHLLVRCVAPDVLADVGMQPFSEGLHEPIRQRLTMDLHFLITGPQKTKPVPSAWFDRAAISKHIQKFWDLISTFFLLPSKARMKKKAVDVKGLW